MFDPTRDQVRSFFFETWRKYRASEPLAGLEAIVLDVILAHPEYHAALEEPDRFRERDYSPELGEPNPFLHLSMHVAIEEQLSIDQPHGVSGLFAALATRHGDRHKAMHDAMECLGEMVWRSQRDRAPPDGAAYLECLKKRAGR
jgi:uncharacterized protein DUF1841